MLDFYLSLNRVLPARTHPQPDELLSSWIVRLAMAHAMKLHTFCTVLWGKRPIWNRDIDKSADDAFLEVLEARTETPHERVHQTTLKAYEGWLYEHHNPFGNTPWIMPLGIYHRVRHRYGLQFCPECLAEDREPYFRRAWRLAFVTVCLKHRAPLFDACPRCDAPVNFHRDELGLRQKPAGMTMVKCHACELDLRFAAKFAAQRRRGIESETSESCSFRLSESEIAFQAKLIRAISDGYITLDNGQTIYSLLYFSVLRQLMKVLAAKRGSRLVDALCEGKEHQHLHYKWVSGKAEIERFRLAARHKLKTLASLLLLNWAEGFVKICEANRIWSSTLLRDFEESPFWYWSVVREHLYRIAYNASEEEIYTVIAFVQKNDHRSYRKMVSRYIGTCDVFRKRKHLANFAEHH